MERQWNANGPRDIGARQLAFEDLETAVAEVEKQQDNRTCSNDAPRRKPPRARRNRGTLPKDLPRIEQVVEPGSLACPCGCGVAIVARSCHRSRLPIVAPSVRARWATVRATMATAQQ